MSENNIGSRVVQQIRRDKTTGNIVSVPIHETVLTSNNKSVIALREISNEWERVQVKDENGNSLNEVFSIDDIIDETKYYVDYSYGNVYFHIDVAGKLMQLDYYGIGNEYLSASAIFTKLDKDGNVIELLSDIIEKGRDYIDAITIFGTAVDVINQLNISIQEGKDVVDRSITVNSDLESNIVKTEGILDDLVHTVSEGKEINTTLTNTNKTATNTNTTLTNTNKTATSTNTTLTNTNKTATETNSTLNTTINTGQNIISNLNNLIGLGKQVAYADSVDDMKSLDLKEGQVVILKGYYSGDTLSEHMRVVSSTDNGFGELLDNGLYANLMYQNYEVNITHIGARNSYNSEHVIYDIIPYVDKIRNKGLTVFIPSGWWAMSFKNFATHSFKIKGCSIQPYFNGENYTSNVCSTVLFPYTDGQEALISLGVTTREIRGSEISNIQIVTNCRQYDSNNNFVAKTTGAKIGMDLKTVCFGDIRNILVTGTNDDVEYGIKFNGCETDFNDIMFRRFGTIGSNVKCAFYNYNRNANSSTGDVAMAVSGMVYNRIDYEGVGCLHFRITGVDAHFTNSCNEFGYIRCASGHSYTAVNYSDIPDGATINHKGFIDIGDGTNGIVFSTITMQKAGQSFKHTYTNDEGDTVEEYDVWDNFFTQSSDYLNNVYFSYDDVVLQEVKKDINVVNFPDNLSYRDSANKGLIIAGKVACDNYQAKIIVRDNMGVQLPIHNHSIPRTNNKFSYNNIQTTFMNRIVTCNDSALQHGVRWNNSRQYEYFSRIIGSNTYTNQYADYLALFNVDEYLLAGTNIIYFYYVNQLNTAITMDVVFTFKDGTTRTETVSFPGTNNSGTKLMKYTFNVDTSKRIMKIEFKNCTSNMLKICRVEHRIS